jgi:hypothetical protein
LRRSRLSFDSNRLFISDYSCIDVVICFILVVDAFRFKWLELGLDLFWDAFKNGWDCLSSGFLGRSLGYGYGFELVNGEILVGI